MNVLVTGVKGLVGRGIAKLFVKEYNVFGLLRSEEKNIIEGVKYLKGDITEKNFLDNFKNIKIDAIIHCAASLDKDQLSEDIINSNCFGIRNLALLAIEKQINNFVYISGTHIIGKPVDVPVTEEHKVSPLISYHTTKYFGELYLNNVLKNIRLSILRLTSPIGDELPDNRILTVFIKKSIDNEVITLSGGGKRIQNYVDVSDIARATDLSIKKNASGVFNIGSDRGVSNLELAKMIIELNKSSSNISFDGVDEQENDKWLISIEKAKNQLGFTPEVKIQETIQELSKRFTNEGTFYK